MKFLYNGPVSAVSLKDDEGNGDEPMLFPGNEYDLPENHPRVDALRQLGHLTEPPKKDTAPAPAPAEPKTKESK